MVEFELKNFDGRLYLKDELKKILGTREVRAIAHADGVLLVAGTTSNERALASLDLIRRELQNRAQEENINRSSK